MHKLALHADLWYNKVLNMIMSGGTANAPDRTHLKWRCIVDTLSPHVQNDNIPSKRCAGPCGRILPATTEHFHRSKKSKDGLVWKCKDCACAYAISYSKLPDVQKRRSDYQKTRQETYRDRSRSAPINRNASRIEYTCDSCGQVAWDKLSSYNKKKRHFCSNSCYSKYRADDMPSEEHNRYGTGFSVEEKTRRVKARSVLNHAIRDGKIERKPCETEGCTNQAEAHHDDYDKSLDVRWLCFKHHREYHKRLYENPELVRPAHE